MRKLWSILLVAAMLLSGMWTTWAETPESSMFAPIGEGSAEEKSEARLTLEMQADGLFDERETVDLVVGLEEEFFRDYGRSYSPQELRDRSNFEPQSEFAAKANAEALERIREAGIEFELLYELDLIMVGFTGSATYGDALRMADLPFIRSVSISPTYEAPSVEQLNSRMPHSNRIIGQHEVVGEYDGRGMVTAVLDSGIDSAHKAFYLSEKGKAAKRIKVNGQAELDQLKSEKKIAKGFYLSEKIPFAYNYANKNDHLKDLSEKSGMHGQHVAGTIAGNRVELNSGDEFLGVAPEAQILGMRVFPEAGGGTGPSVYLAAINDAVKLGADSINMSLGSPSGQLSDVPKSVTDAIDAASQIGCVVAIAAGNESQFGYGVSNPRAEYPDYGILGSPAVATWSMAVASYENTHVVQAAIRVTDGGSTVRKISYRMPKTPVNFDATKSYETLDAGFGEKAEDMPDLTGKVALIERGKANFSTKVENAAARGAVGVIIYNDAKNGDRHFGMGGLEKVKIPAVSIKRTDGLFLKDNPSYKVNINDKGEFMPSDDAGRISEFSNWGLPAD